MRMRWVDLLFAHWPVPAEAVAAFLPPGLEVDTFEGRAWVGVVPFRMEGVGPLLPFGGGRALTVPGLSAFPELNVRTYVTSRADGRAGVWFWSLDARSRLAVRAARWLFHLPYYDARMTAERRGEEIVYRSERTHRGTPPARFVARYGPTGPVYRAEPGTLEHWLTERYRLYAARLRPRRGGGGEEEIFAGDVHHAPWPLQPATAEIEEDTLTASLATEPAFPESVRGSALPRPDEPPLLHFARRLDVVAWRPVRLPAA